MDGVVVSGRGSIEQGFVILGLANGPYRFLFSYLAYRFVVLCSVGSLLFGPLRLVFSKIFGIRAFYACGYGYVRSCVSLHDSLVIRLASEATTGVS